MTISEAVNILEIGTLNGHPAVLMAIEPVTIEINKPLAETASKNMSDVGLSEKIEVKRK
jgi:predicted O-methyltransferase YrrM